MVILSPQEQEYLLHALDTAHAIRELRQLYLWSQGALQALLPHRALLCLRLDGEGRVGRVDCLHSSFLDAATLARLCDVRKGPAALLLRAWQQAGAQPLAAEAADFEHDFGQAADAAAAHVLVHGSGALAEGATAFALLGLAQPPTLRQRWLLQLLLPSLHLALQRIAAEALPRPAAPEPAVSARQAQILHGLRSGKSNAEIAASLGISALTVKNHLQRLYRQLGVNNRAHAVARCAGLNFD